MRGILNQLPADKQLMLHFSPMNTTVKANTRLKSSSIEILFTTNLVKKMIEKSKKNLDNATSLKVSLYSDRPRKQLSNPVIFKLK